MSKMSRESDKTVQPAFLPNLRFDDLRYTHATQMLRRSAGIKARSQRLGHGDIKVTKMVFWRDLPANDRAIAEGLDRLNG